MLITVVISFMIKLDHDSHDHLDDHQLVNDDADDDLWTRALGALRRTSDPKSNEVRVDRKSGAQGRPDSPEEEGKPRASLTLPPYIQLHTSQVLEPIQGSE